MENKRPLISVANLCKDFRRPNGQLFSVLENIQFDIFDNEFVAILGLSGSGKSTLLRCMSQLIKPDRGRVVYAPLPVENKRKMSFVFQSFGLFPWFTVRENIAVAMKDLEPTERNRRIDEVLDAVGLEGFDDAYPRELSGGMKQRVGFCRAIVDHPMILFMDEPFGALDPLTSESLRAEIGRMWTSKDRKIRSIVMVTHSIEEAVSLADRIIILSSNPGQVYKICNVNLKRPRNIRSSEYLETKETIERTFGELHLSKLDSFQMASQQSSTNSESRAPNTLERGLFEGLFSVPIVNTSLMNVEGLIMHLIAKGEGANLSSLSYSMGESIDVLMPTIIAAEMLGFITTPGIQIVLTALGKKLGTEEDQEKRQQILKQACMNHPLIFRIYQLVKARPDGLDREVVISQLAALLPYENPDAQFEALVKWCRQCDIMNYDANTNVLYLDVEEE